MDLMKTTRTNPKETIPGPTKLAELRALAGSEAGARASESERTTPGEGAGDDQAMGDSVGDGEGDG
ncbi:hypothetical protein DY000_02054476 [Brassica cretica]|uniref:Uncharacterized protein n=1 Tax=Brassica cretica TaxID=69181 RepID=A0ABQ7A9P9_BRACR|nr:hypothetical protein DY000_02054476 [Brassica cretica]